MRFTVFGRRRAFRAGIAAGAVSLGVAAGGLPAADAGTLTLYGPLGPTQLISAPAVSDPCSPLGYPNLSVGDQVRVCDNTTYSFRTDVVVTPVGFVAYER